MKGLGIGGGIGTIAGLFMGSPIIGTIAGSAIGFAAKSNKVQQYLFGEKDEEGKYIKEGIIPKDLIEATNKRLPGMVIGGAAGLLAGPFGVVGNLLIGSGLGFLASSNSFHDYIFGDPNVEGDKGLAGIIHDKLIKNIDEFFRNFVAGTAGFLKKTGKSIESKIKSLFESARGFFIRRIKGIPLLDRIATKTGKVVKGATSLVGDTLGRINTATKKGNLKHGYSVYDKGKYLYAAERNKLRDELNMGGNDTFSNLDTLLSGYNNIEDLNQTRDVLMGLQNSKYAKKKADNDVLKEVKSYIVNLDNGTQNAVLKALKTGDYDTAREILANAGPEGYRARIRIESSINALKDNADTNKLKEKSKQALSKLGLKNIKDSEITTMLDAINRESKHSRFSQENQKAIKAEQVEKDFKGNLIGLIASIESTMVAKKKKNPYICIRNHS